MEDLNVNIDVEVNTLEEVKELRRELEKIKELKKEIEDDTGINIPDNDPIDIPRPDPRDNPYRPEFPKFPKEDRWFICGNDSNENSFKVQDIDTAFPDDNLEVTW
jgi:hypothetical protein